jgi:hypothetical protein
MACIVSSDAINSNQPNTCLAGAGNSVGAKLSEGIVVYAATVEALSYKMLYPVIIPGLGDVAAVAVNR